MAKLISVADITTGHDHLTATPTPAMIVVSSTPTHSSPCNFGKAFHAYDTGDTCWIIDSGATDYMMYNSALFSNTFPHRRDHVLIANNATTTVTWSDLILYS